MKLRWETASYGRKAWFADTPRDATIAYGSGRWFVERGYKTTFFILKFSGTFIGSYPSKESAMHEAETRTGS